MKNKFTSYDENLQELELENLHTRRHTLSKKFGKKCLTNEKTKSLFQKNEKEHQMKTRKSDHIKVTQANKERMKQVQSTQ